MKKTMYIIFLIGFQTIVCSDDTSINFIPIEKKSNLKLLPQEIASKEKQEAKYLHLVKNFNSGIDLNDDSENYSDSDFEEEMPVYGRDTSMNQARASFEQLRTADYQKYRAILDQKSDQTTTEELLKISFDLLGKLGLSVSLSVDEITSAQKYLFKDTKGMPLDIKKRLSGEFQILEEIAQKKALPCQVSPRLFEKVFNQFFGLHK